MKLSVVIRNKNQAKDLAICLAALQKQVVLFSYEVVIIDNESTDESLHIAEQHHCKILSISNNEFTYGRALNKAIATSEGEIILILSTHVVLLSNHFINSIPSFFENNQIAGIRFTESSNYSAIKKSVAHPNKIIQKQDKSMVMQAWENGTVNHCAAIQKSVWNNIPYDENVFYSEDKIWSLKVLEAGFSLQINTPLFYKYNKQFTRQQSLERRANEAAAYQLFTNKKAISNPHYLKNTFNFFLIQLRNFYSNMHAHFWVKQTSKKIVKQQQHHFNI